MSVILEGVDEYKIIILNNCNMIFAFRLFCFNSRVLTLDI